MKMRFFLGVLSLALVAWTQKPSTDNSNDWNLSLSQPNSGALFDYTFKKGYLSGRKLRVFIPSHYFKDQRKYDVVYFHDGQMLFDSTTTWNHQSWDLVQALERYMPDKRVILVGIDNQPEHRYAEFFPAPIFAQLPPSVQSSLMDSLWKGPPRFDSYSDALLNEVFPLIEDRWRVSRGGKHRSMVGSSMGGIVSLTFLLAHPKEVQTVIGLSLHLPLINSWQFKDRYKNDLSAAFNAYVSKRFSKIKGKTLYIDRGDKSLDATYGPYFPSFEQALLEGMEQNQTIVKCIPFSGHSERDWAKRIGPIMHDLIK